MNASEYKVVLDCVNLLDSGLFSADVNNKSIIACVETKCNGMTKRNGLMKFMFNF